MVNYFKGDPAKFVIRYVAGKAKQSGRGISFFYQAYHTNIVAIPAMTLDSNFIFNEVSKDFQSITLQGHFTYQITDPRKMADILDFSIDPVSRRYRSDDPEKLELRIKNVMQMLTRTEIKKLTLEEAINVTDELSLSLLERVPSVPIMIDMGIQVMSITFTTISPTAEIARALEADYREGLQKKADEAIYARRAAAVEQERTIKEAETQTEITLEEKRRTLIELAGENTIKDAQFKADAKKMELEAYKDTDPKLMLALALKGLADNANKIGNLTITSEILSQIMNERIDD
ncbi:MAG TPA: SPFH domain-containing protein [Candidatus Lokiarchaeia archaeon]|nr:SPFH domain-containing protein [Candidatus Lokiarchaeia archaeon]